MWAQYAKPDRHLWQQGTTAWHRCGPGPSKPLQLSPQQSKGRVSQMPWSKYNPHVPATSSPHELRGTEERWKKWKSWSKQDQQYMCQHTLSHYGSKFSWCNWGWGGFPRKSAVCKMCQSLEQLLSVYDGISTSQRQQMCPIFVEQDHAIKVCRTTPYSMPSELCCHVSNKSHLKPAGVRWWENTTLILTSALTLLNQEAVGMPVASASADVVNPAKWGKTINHIKVGHKGVD